MATANSRLSLRLKVSLRLFILGLLAVGIATVIHRSNTTTKQELDKLTGRWIHVATEYGNETSTDVGERDVQVWEIEGNQLTRYVDGKESDVARIELQLNVQPKRMDLVPRKDLPANATIGFFTRTLCLYSLNGNELKVAVSFYFAPGTPEAERKRAIKDAQTRPNSFDTQYGDVAVITFKREHSLDPTK